MEILGGPFFAVAGAGESHGPGVTTIIFGCPPGLLLNRQQIQTYLDQRRPGGNRHGTPRNEKDKVIFLSGLYQEDHEALIAGPEIQVTVEGNTFTSNGYETGFTTGEPIAALVLSSSTKSRHYDQFKGEQGAARPGHTDLVKYHKSKGFVDIRGGGRSSYRSTISDVIGGSIARIFLQNTFGTVILSSISQVGPLKADKTLSQHFTTLVQQSNSQTIAPEAIASVQETMNNAEIHSIDPDFAQEAGELIKKRALMETQLGLRWRLLRSMCRL